MIINKKGEQLLELDNKIVHITNLDKIFWPNERFTKGDLIQYYIDIAEYILPYLLDRPESLLRFPNGIKGKSFYQKNISNQPPPSWVKTTTVHSNGDKTEYLLITNSASLIYTINLGCIDLNPWNSKVDSIDFPSYLIIDLDPLNVDFGAVIETALHCKQILDEFGIDSFVKTSGATGMHIFIPLNNQYDYEDVRNFGQILVNKIHKKAPKITSIERSPSKRGGCVYLDYLQNAKGQTLASVYSVRAREKATVSAPLHWTEVKKGVQPTDFTIENMPERIKKVGDIFKPVLGSGVEILKVLEKIEP